MNVWKEIKWDSPHLVNDEPIKPDSGKDARSIHPGQFGSQYPRMLILDDDRWLVVYTVYRNNGYLAETSGGNTLVVALSQDAGTHWHEISELRDLGRDLDNGQMLELPNGELLLACRSVIWQQSYQLPVYKSSDGGYTWECISIIDENSGNAGELGDPDRGVYEPHMLYLDDGAVAVMYASEKYASENPAFSQILSEKVSYDRGKTWGKEIVVVCDEVKSAARPGMPVMDRLPDGRYFLVYEIIATEGGDMFWKISPDGIHWPDGIGRRIPDQKGGAYVLALDDGTLLVTSNTHHVSISHDAGESWVRNPISPWETLWDAPNDNGATCTVENGNVWPSIYRLSDGRIVYLTSVGRSYGGNNIQYRIGELSNELNP